MTLPDPQALDDLAALLDAEKGVRAAVQAILVRNGDSDDQHSAQWTHETVISYIVETCRAIVAKADA